MAGLISGVRISYQKTLLKDERQCVRFRLNWITAAVDDHAKHTAKEEQE